jgi:hypothetical protein
MYFFLHMAESNIITDVQIRFGCVYFTKCSYVFYLSLNKMV